MDCCRKCTSGADRCLPIRKLKTTYPCTNPKLEQTVHHHGAGGADEFRHLIIDLFLRSTGVRWYIYHGRILGRAELAPIAGIGSYPPS